MSTTLEITDLIDPRIIDGLCKAVSEAVCLDEIDCREDSDGIAKGEEAYYTKTDGMIVGYTVQVEGCRTLKNGRRREYNGLVDVEVNELWLDDDAQDDLTPEEFDRVLALLGMIIFKSIDRKTKGNP